MKSLIIIFTSLTISYLSCDYLYSMKKKSYKANIFSDDCIKNSIEYGYEYHPNKKCRYKRVEKNHLEYDNIFYTNNFGFVSDLNYQLEKQSDEKRAVVLGYSMAEGNYLKINWPTKATMLADSNIQFYNFARAGYFNLNLYNIYFDIVSKFSFDYLFLPTLGKTDKQFMIFQKRVDGIYDGLFTNAPRDQNDFDVNFHQKMSHMYTFFNSEEPEPYLNQFNITSQNYVLLKNHVNKLFSERVATDPLGKHDTSLISEYQNSHFYQDFGERNINIFFAIISHALKKGAKVVFYQDPKKGKHPSEEKKDSTYSFYRWLKEKHPEEIFYLDGNDFFKKYTKKEYNDFFFRYDGHWNQTGSDIFAKGASSFLKKIQ